MSTIFQKPPPSSSSSSLFSDASSTSLELSSCQKLFLENVTSDLDINNENDELVTNCDENATLTTESLKDLDDQEIILEETILSSDAKRRKKGFEKGQTRTFDGNQVSEKTSSFDLVNTVECFKDDPLSDPNLKRNANITVVEEKKIKESLDTARNFQSLEEFNQMSMFHNSSEKILANELAMSRDRIDILVKEIFELKGLVLQEQNEKSEIIMKLKNYELYCKDAIFETHLKNQEPIETVVAELAQRKIQDLNEYIQSLKSQMDETEQEQIAQTLKLQDSLSEQKKDGEKRIEELSRRLLSVKEESKRKQEERERSFDPQIYEKEFEIHEGELKSLFQKTLSDRAEEYNTMLEQIKSENTKTVQLHQKSINDLTTAFLGSEQSDIRNNELSKKQKDGLRQFQSVFCNFFKFIFLTFILCAFFWEASLFVERGQSATIEAKIQFIKKLGESVSQCEKTLHPLREDHLICQNKLAAQEHMFGQNLLLIEGTLDKTRQFSHRAFKGKGSFHKPTYFFCSSDDMTEWEEVYSYIEPLINSVEAKLQILTYLNC